MSVAIEIKNLGKVIAGKEIIKDLNLSISPGSIVSIFGPNGTGKTTLLNLISGTDPQYSGSIKKECAQRINVSYIFQNYRDSLLHWRNGRENIALPLEIGDSKDQIEIKEVIDEIALILDLKIDLSKYPYQYSGGQQQILSFARAIVTKPNLLLIDEPFSALDYENNLFLRECLIGYYEKYKPTIIIITHSIEEAVHLSHDIVVFSKLPTHVHEVIKNASPHPRGLDYLASPYFNDLKDKLLASFRDVTHI
ncbi:MAG: nitrate transporter ATP-binding protein [Candidatus Taylorbacteria bacterium]|nr:nitrate transporter ATP-binding protein [Candidatus Taylorbacteria bacterium]